jgi:hypothetical protein
MTGSRKLALLTGGVSSELRYVVVLFLDTGDFGVADVWSVLTKTQVISVWSVYLCGPGPPNGGHVLIMLGVAVTDAAVVVERLLTAWVPK